MCVRVCVCVWGGVCVGLCVSVCLSVCAHLILMNVEHRICQHVQFCDVVSPPLMSVEYVNM